MKLIIKLIYYILEKLNTHSEEKLIKSFQLEGIKVMNENGWTNATHIHLTKPFQVYKLMLENGLELECADEHIVFVEGFEEKWVKDLTPNDKVITENGLSRVLKVEKKDIYINMCDLTVDNPKHSYYTNSILSHNTTTSAVFMLHYILFNVDKNALVLGNKRKTAVEILDKAKKIYLEIPYFLKPGIYKWNEGEIALDNGCRLMAEATTINSGISFTFHCVLADEFAHVAPNILDKFYNNLFPTITAGKARFMITSTQNGFNLFSRLYLAAEAGENDYAPFKTDWYEVPEWNPELKIWEVRDEIWHARQVANYGSEEAFNKQFGTNFDVSANTLISGKILSLKSKEAEDWVEKDLPGIPLNEKWIWKPSYEPADDLKKDFIIFTADLAEGIGQDSTVFLCHKLMPGKNEDMECVGMFKSNNNLLKDCITSLQILVCMYCDFNKLLISFERNTYGELFLNNIYKNIETNQLMNEKFDLSCLVKHYNEGSKKYQIGIKITSGNKTTYCLLFKDSYERGFVVNNNSVYTKELYNFCDDGNGHYKASFGHDDIVMSQIQLEFVKQTLQYKFLRREFEDMNEEESNQLYNPYTEMNNSNNFYNYQEEDFNKRRLL